MNVRLLLLAASATALLLCACQTTRSSSNYASTGDISSLSSELAAQRSAITQTNANIKQLSDNQNQLYLKLQGLEQNLNVLSVQSGNTDAIQQFQQQLSGIRAEIKAVDDARIRDNKALADGVSSQLNKQASQINALNTALRQAAARPVSSGTSTASTSAAPAGEYYKHTVKAGQTLGAIAQAYGVTVKEIQTANKMSNTNLSINQVLLVPKK